MSPSALKATSSALGFWGLFAVAAAGAVHAHGFLVSLALALVAGVSITVLYILGHDAGHYSLAPGRKHNEWLGRFVFLPSLQPYSVFQFIHNRFHHRYTNLLTDDWVWRPLTLREYQAAARPRRWLYRFERGPLGFLLYYALEIWARRLAFPFYRELGTIRSAFVLDALLIWSFLGIEVSVLVAWGYEAGGSIGALRSLSFGIAIPLLVYNSLIGMFLYLQHTHPDIPWFASREDWRFFRAQISGSVHIELPSALDALFQRVLHHTAHHAMPQIPTYRLEEAQRRLEDRYPGKITTFRWSPRAYWNVTSRCKLYDVATHRWVDYDGKPTTGPLVQS